MTPVSARNIEFVGHTVPEVVVVRPAVDGEDRRARRVDVGVAVHRQGDTVGGGDGRRGGHPRQPAAT